MIQELEKNPLNNLGVPLETGVNLKTMCDELQAMDRNAIMEALNRKRKDLGLYKTSYGMYFLGNRYLQEMDFQSGMYYLHIAADQYYNPLAMTRLARIYFSTLDRIQASFPQYEGDFQQDLAKAYYYINAAMLIGGLIQKSSGDKYVLDLVVANGLSVLDSYNLGSVRGQFDFQGTDAKVKTQMVELEAAYKKMYGL